MRSSASRQVALRLFRQNPQQIDGGARAHDVHPRPLALLRARAHLQHRAQVELLHQVLESHRRLRTHRRILCADQILDALRRSVVGGLRLAAFFGRRRGRKFLRQLLLRPPPPGCSRFAPRCLASFTTRRGPGAGSPCAGAVGFSGGAVGAADSPLSFSSSAFILRRSMTSNFGVSLIPISFSSAAANSPMDAFACARESLSSRHRRQLRFLHPQEQLGV